MSAPRREDESIQLCAFWVGQEEYAIDIKRIEEILPPLPVTALPHAPAFVDGLVHLRGGIVPVIDLRRRLGSGAPRVTGKSGKKRFLICRIGRRRIALVVDAVSEVVRTTIGALEPTPPLVSRGVSPYVIGVSGTPDRLKLLLDVKALLLPDVQEKEAR